MSIIKFNIKKMKNKISIISTVLLIACIFTFNNCSEAQFDEKYTDPSKTGSVELEKLLPGTLLWSKEWAMSDYGRFFGWESQVLMKQANTVGCTPVANQYYDLQGYTDGMPPYGKLSQMIASYNFMVATSKKMSEADRAGKDVYLYAAETHMYAMMAFIMSNFGDIPFTEVGQVATSQDVATAHPHYEDDKELYTLILDNLATLNTNFAKVTNPDPLFKTQDILNKGDLDKWQRYVNSIRLRVALLVSTQGPLASKGQGVLKEILENPTTYPIIESNAQNTCMAQVVGGNSALDVNGGSGFDWIQQRTASKQIINRMQKAGDGGVWVKGQDDPRLPILFCLATPNGEFPVDPNKADDAAAPPTPQYPKGKALATVFRGFDAETDPAEYAVMRLAATRAKYSFIREHGFFRENRNWDNPIITAAEVSFIKAEAIQRGWAAGDAKAAFVNGIKQSIESYFNYQKGRSTDQVNHTGDEPYNIIIRSVIPLKKSEDAAWCDSFDEAWITAFAEARWSTKIDGSPYTEQVEAILEQKWLNFGFMYSGEQWNDLRRTGYPRMTYPRDIGTNTARCPIPRNRSKYPESEENNNMNFKEQVGSQNNFYDVLFWAIKDWHDGPTE
jgi:hypothetical protein